MSLLTAANSRNDLYVSADEAGLFNMPRGSVGQRKSANPLDRIKTYANANPQGAQVSTCTVTASPTNNAVETVTVAGQPVSYTADGSATRAEVTTGLLAALQADPVAGRAATYTGNTGTGVITATGVNPGISFTFTTASPDLTCALVTAAAAADSVPFGIAMVKVPNSYYYGSECCAVASTANLTAQVDTWTMTYTSGEKYHARITVDGESYDAQFTGATDLDTTNAGLVAAVNAVMPAYTVIAVAGATTTGLCTLTAEVNGKAFVAEVWVESANPSRLTLAHTTAGPATDFWRVFVGVSEIANDSEGTYTSTSDSGATSYKPNAGVKCVSKVVDGIYVDNSQIPTDSSDVYISLDPSAPGQWFTDASPQYRLKVTPPNRNRVRWQGNPDMAADGIAILEVSL